jgi:hypothetical protein
MSSITLRSSNGPALTFTEFLDHVRVHLPPDKKEETASEATGAKPQRLDVWVPVDLDGLSIGGTSVRLRFDLQPGPSLTVSLESTPGNFHLILELDNATKQSSLEYVDASRLDDQMVGANPDILSKIEKPGRWLVRLAIALSDHLEMQTMKIGDISEVQCTKGPMDLMDLKYISLMKSGKTWYQTIANFEFVGEGSAEIMQKWEDVRHTPLRELERSLQNIQTLEFWEQYNQEMGFFLACASKEEKESQQQTVMTLAGAIVSKIQEFTKSKNGPPLLLYQFLTWLAHIHCELWLEMYTLTHYPVSSKLLVPNLLPEYMERYGKSPIYLRAAIQHLETLPDLKLILTIRSLYAQIPYSFELEISRTRDGR